MNKEELRETRKQMLPLVTAFSPRDSLSNFLRPSGGKRQNRASSPLGLPKEFAQMEQRLQEMHPKEEDRIFFEIPRPLCLKGLHLSLYPLSSDEGKIDYGQKPPCIKGLVKITKLSSYG